MSHREEQQAGEMADQLEALEARYPDIPRDLADELRGLTERFKAARDLPLRRDGMRIIGQTHMSIREHQDRTDSRVAGMHEDMAGMHGEQDLAAARAAVVTQAIADLVAVHTDTRLTELEARVSQIEARAKPRRPAAQATKTQRSKGV
jgi:hypothetical protein